MRWKHEPAREGEGDAVGVCSDVAENFGPIRPPCLGTYGGVSLGLYADGRLVYNKDVIAVLSTGGARKDKKKEAAAAAAAAAAAEAEADAAAALQLARTASGSSGSSQEQAAAAAAAAKAKKDKAKAAAAASASLSAAAGDGDGDEDEDVDIITFEDDEDDKAADQLIPTCRHKHPMLPDRRPCGYCRYHSLSLSLSPPLPLFALN
jgi:hypothetical protein